MLGDRLRWVRRLAALGGASLCVVGAAVTPAAADGSIRADQWHLDAMHAPEMWKISKGRGVTVAVIDGGFKLDHPDLEGQFLPGKDFSESPGGVGSYKEGHGTQMASLIARTGKSDGGRGAYGLAPGARVLPVKIANGSEHAVVSADFLDQIGQAVTYAVEQGAKVINISQGTAAVTTSPADVEKLNRILAWARAKGSLVVSSVGNSGDKGNLVEYPGALPNVVGVGASDRNATVTAESERGPQVVLVAPGMDIIGACASPTGYCKSHGTSDATALVSASAALVWSVHPDWTANQVLRVLINTAGKANDGAGRNDIVGYGAVRPRIALTDPGDPGPADVSPLAADVVVPAAAPSPSASAVAAAPVAPAPVVPSPADVPTVQPQAEVPAPAGGSTLPVVAGVVAALVLVAGVVFAVMRRGRRPGGQSAVYGPPLPPPPPLPSYQQPVPPEDNPYAR
ncbi:S8 family serine peptidase [Kitasatospora sp. NPDC004799]|uniref:S8 family serine peptidase n=1 Tax=Kitasatospora sp. NPDC004799 TaxID=3154460 RepID=UPI0033B7633F